MYAHEDEIERELKFIELQKQRLELKQLEAELENERAKQGTVSFEAIKRLSRSAKDRLCMFHCIFWSIDFVGEVKLAQSEPVAMKGRLYCFHYVLF